jgi:2-dehydro-3-deoxy-D-arabinonate dehydratase
MQIIRYRSSAGKITVGLLVDNKVIADVPPLEDQNATLQNLLHVKLGDLEKHIEHVQRLSVYNQEKPHALPEPYLAPIDGETEVWAAGVTYKRSEEARREESGTPDIYSQVYLAERPEIFFKANPRRVAGPETPIVIRADSTWDVPEPELAIVLNSYGEIVGYTIANDMSSRSIEGENPLYLPQAKVYAGCCGLGPGITPSWEVENPYALTITMKIERAGAVHWQGSTSTEQLHRRLDDLATFLFREDNFPHGAILCTGTGLVPDYPFTLEAGDLVEISIDQLGTLRNPVVRGKASLHTKAPDTIPEK